MKVTQKRVDCKEHIALKDRSELPREPVLVYDIKKIEYLNTDQFFSNDYEEFCSFDTCKLYDETCDTGLENSQIAISP